MTTQGMVTDRRPEIMSTETTTDPRPDMTSQKMVTDRRLDMTNTETSTDPLQT